MALIGNKPSGKIMMHAVAGRRRRGLGAKPADLSECPHVYLVNDLDAKSGRRPNPTFDAVGVGSVGGSAKKVLQVRCS